MPRCAACGAPLVDRTKRARYCDAKCRVAFSRGHRAPAVVVEIGPVEVVDDAAEGPAPLLDLEDIARELQRALRSPSTPPSAKAGLSKELRATLAEIERRKPKEKDGVDELAARRASRVAGGA